MSYDEFQDWISFGRLEPWDMSRDDWRSAMLGHVMWKLWAGKTSTIDDFMPKLKTGENGVRRQSQEEMRAKLMLFASMHNRSAKGRPKPSPS